MKVLNAKKLPELFYGIHMAPGVAEYRDPEVNDGSPYRILIEEDTIKNMDSSFRGKPVFVKHVDEVDLATVEKDADGWVIRSFYNQFDGKHWVEFLVTSDAGHDAVQRGWKLSNAYIPKEMGSGGEWHAVPYAKKVTRAEYEHLAIVPNPRYDESIILTPEQFKAYNSEKELELKRCANSKDDKGDRSMLKFFKKTKVEKSADLEGLSVSLPKSGKEVTLDKMINDYDEGMMSGCYANGEHKVKVGEEEMTVNELVEKHMALKDSMKSGEDASDSDAHAAEGRGEGERKANDEDEEAKKKAEEIASHEAKEIEAKKKNEAAEKKKNFDKLKNADVNAKKKEEPKEIDLSMDQLARGRARYGSQK